MGPREGEDRKVQFLCPTATSAADQADPEGPERTGASLTAPRLSTLRDGAKGNARSGQKSAGERFRAKYEVRANGCWEWIGALQTNGYGSFGVGAGKSMLAHRWSYEHHVGPIPDGLTIDHLCRNRRCVNPKHIEPVTIAENTRRGESPFAKNARATHCKRGHELTADNLRTRKDGRRQCKACQKQLFGWPYQKAMRDQKRLIRSRALKIEEALR